MTSQYFQVYNNSTERWVKYDRKLAKVVDHKKSKGPYANIPIWRSHVKAS